MSKSKVDKRQIIRKVVFSILFVIYMVALIYLLFRYDREPKQTVSYNVVPFQEIKRYINVINMPQYRWYAILNLFGNVICFIPFGFFVPALFKGGESFWKIVLISIVFTVSIECLQYFTKLGSYDVDDIILNTLGGILGGILYMVIRFIYRKIRGSDDVKKKEKV